jgi:hypothetical protein
MAIRFIFKISAGVLFWDDGAAAYSVDGTSGRGSYMNKPLYTHVKDQGPIPIGGYTMKAVHCGSTPGSAGCIDIGGGLSGDTDTELVKSEILGSSGGVAELEVIA